MTDVRNTLTERISGAVTRVRGARTLADAQTMLDPVPVEPEPDTDVLRARVAELEALLGPHLERARTLEAEIARRRVAVEQARTLVEQLEGARNRRSAEHSDAVKADKALLARESEARQRAIAAAMEADRVAAEVQRDRRKTVAEIDRTWNEAHRARQAYEAARARAQEAERLLDEAEQVARRG